MVAYDRVTEDREAIARELCAKRHAAYVHPFDDPDVIAGQGTVGLEMMEQAAALGAVPDIVLVGASGGGLIGGVSMAVKEKSPATLQSTASSPPASTISPAPCSAVTRQRNSKPAGSICDALLSATPGEITFEMGKRNLAGGLAVTDEEALAAVRFAFRELKLVLEPGGAVSLAADPRARSCPSKARPSRSCCRAATLIPRCLPRSSSISARRHERAESRPRTPNFWRPAFPSFSRPSSLSPASTCPFFRCGWTGKVLARARSPIITAVPLFVRVVVTPVIAFAADRANDHRLLSDRAFLGRARGAHCAVAVGGFWPILFCSLAFALAWTTIMPLTETIAL